MKPDKSIYRKESCAELIDMDVLISEEVSGVLTVEPDAITDYAVKVCRAAGCSHADINIVFIGDEKMTELNEAYKKKNGTTDVLSFDLSDPPVKPGDSFLLEGEVYVSLDRAKIQAKDFSTGNFSSVNFSSGKDNTPFEKEVVRLVTHGLLHLTGRTHDTPESYRAMADETEKMIAMYWEDDVSLL